MPNMQTGNKSKPILITSDWHLRYSQPKCRIDDFKKTQISVLKQIAQIAHDNNCSGIICAGDVFHRAKSYPITLDLFMDVVDFFKDIPFFCIYGNHDLPNHTSIKKEECNLYFVLQHSNIKYMKNNKHTLDDCCIHLYDFDSDYIVKEINNKHTNIGVFHEYIKNRNSEKTWEKERTSTATAFKKYKEMDLIITGDNHQSFVIENKRRKQILINPGCITIQNINEMNYDPSVYLYWPVEHKWKRISLEGNDISCFNTTYIEREVEKLKRKEDVSSDFVKSLNKLKINSLNFKKYVQEYTTQSKLDINIKTKINTYIGERF